MPYTHLKNQYFQKNFKLPNKSIKTQMFKVYIRVKLKDFWQELYLSQIINASAASMISFSATLQQEWTFES